MNDLTTFADTATGWQRALYAFLTEKQRRSGSHRTVEGYSRMLQDFFGRLGKQPNEVSSRDIFAYAHGPGLSGKQPSGSYYRCPHRLPQFILPVLDPHGTGPVHVTGWNGHRSHPAHRGAYLQTKSTRASCRNPRLSGRPA